MGKSVLITGTSTGIGRACVDRMAADGWTVYAGVRKDTDADALKQAVSGDVRPVLLDVTDQKAIDRVRSQIETDVGDRGLDGLVNNAGANVGGPFEGLTDEDWRWQFDVNVFGLVNTTRACFDLLRQAKGRIVNIGSIGGRIASPFMGPYSATKHAVEAISEGLRFEVEQFGMTVSCVEPGSIKTAIWEKGQDQIDEMNTRFGAEMLSNYQFQLDAMYGFADEGPKKGSPPSKVADVVHHALTANRPKPRYLVGTGSVPVGVVSKLPDPLRKRMLMMRMNQLAKAGKKLR
jgi:NAD(P)-dependent dehydrogenase (short-subunit alcohol dehydrogenase family)